MNDPELESKESEQSPPSREPIPSDGSAVAEPPEEETQQPRKNRRSLLPDKGFGERLKDILLGPLACASMLATTYCFDAGEFPFGGHVNDITSGVLYSFAGFMLYDWYARMRSLSARDNDERHDYDQN